MTTQQALAIAQQRIDELQQLADVQALLINEKNDAIAERDQRIADLEAALRHAQSHSYADDLRDAVDEVQP